MGPIWTWDYAGTRAAPGIDVLGLMGDLGRLLRTTLNKTYETSTATTFLLYNVAMETKNLNSHG
jgi:hypothetical protein